MKKELMILFVVLFILPTVLAESCDLEATLVNQDPYPAVPGEYVKVVFQVTGVENPTCGTIEFEMIEDFPFSLDPDVDTVKSILGGGYVSGYSSFWIVPYKVRISKEAVEGDVPLKVYLRSKIGVEGENYVSSEDFDIYVEDTQTDFEISIKDYDYATNEITFEILNIGDEDVEALTVEIPKQNNIIIKGGNREIVGSLDSNEDATFTFEAIPDDGEITVNIIYTDTIGERRSITKSVSFDSSYFKGRNSDNKGRSGWFYVTVILILGIIYYWYRQRQKRKRMKKLKHSAH